MFTDCLTASGRVECINPSISASPREKKKRKKKHCESYFLQPQIDVERAERHEARAMWIDPRGDKEVERRRRGGEAEGEMDKWQFYFHLGEGEMEQLVTQTHTCTHTHTHTHTCTHTHTHTHFLQSFRQLNWHHVEHKAKRSGFLHNGCVCDTVGEPVCLISSLTALFYPEIIAVSLKRCSLSLLLHTHTHTQAHTQIHTFLSAWLCVSIHVCLLSVLTFLPLSEITSPLSYTP